jgi:hypothetical protein
MFFITAESYDQTSTKDRIILDTMKTIKEEIFPSFKLWYVNPLLGNGSLKHVSEVMTEPSIPRQSIQKRFRCKGRIKIVHTATKDTFVWQSQKRRSVPLHGVFHIRSVWRQLRSRELTKYRTEDIRYWRVLPSGRNPGSIEEKRVGTEVLTEFVKGASQKQKCWRLCVLLFQ